MLKKSVREMSHNLLPEEALYFIQQYTPLEILAEETAKKLSTLIHNASNREAES